jgi:hypothetical protein
MSMIALTLPGTKTYPFRSASWQKVSPAGSPVVGVLQFNERKTFEGGTYVTRYSVYESGWMRGRVFKLTKGEFFSETYVYLSGVSGEPDRCDCVGYFHTGRCRHSEALRLLERGGELKGMLDTITEGINATTEAQEN